LPPCKKIRVAEQLTTQETEPPSQKDREFDKKLRLEKNMIFDCVDTLPSLDYPQESNSRER
jgi:hypothetical protein